MKRSGKNDPNYTSSYLEQLQSGDVFDDYLAAHPDPSGTSTPDNTPPAEEPDEERAPWLRQEKETTKQYAVFRIYRDLGAKRSLRLAAQKFYGTGFKTPYLKNVKRWSVKANWVQRA